MNVLVLRSSKYYRRWAGVARARPKKPSMSCFAGHVSLIRAPYLHADPQRGHTSPSSPHPPHGRRRFEPSRPVHASAGAPPPIAHLQASLSLASRSAHRRTARHVAPLPRGRPRPI